MIAPESMDQLKDGFWEAVADCLEEFHQLPRAEAIPKVREARSRLDLGDASPSYPDIIYNAEPFSIANDIAARQLDRREFNEA